MAVFYTRSLQELPKMRITDVHRICSLTSKTPATKMDKGFKLYASSYIMDYEVSNKDKLTGDVSIKAACHRSMRKSEKPHSLRTAEMKRGAEMESEAAVEYSKMKNVNYRPCGLIIHPDAPWLGASPDGLIYDPSTQPPFGLVEIKCPNVKSYVDCKYIQMQHGTSALRESHSHFWQIQGQLLITGLQWCDFVVCAQEDMMVKRIYADPKVTVAIRERVDQFYFNVYMPKYLSFSKRV